MDPTLDVMSFPPMLLTVDPDRWSPCQGTRASMLFHQQYTTDVRSDVDRLTWLMEHYPSFMDMWNHMNQSVFGQVSSLNWNTVAGMSDNGMDLGGLPNQMSFSEGLNYIHALSELGQEAGTIRGADVDRWAGTQQVAALYMKRGEGTPQNPVLNGATGAPINVNLKQVAVGPGDMRMFAQTLDPGPAQTIQLSKLAIPFPTER